MMDAITEEIHFALADSALALVLVARSARGVCAVLLGDERDELRRELREYAPRAMLVEGDEVELAALAERIAAFVERPAGVLDFPLDLRGTELQRQVWQALREIPAGETLSYTELARRVGRPRAVRAVASACAANRLAVVVPCHRAVRSDESLAGYRWGVERKRILLEREAKF